MPENEKICEDLKKDSSVGFRRILLVFIVILGVVLFLLAPGGASVYLKKLAILSSDSDVAAASSPLPTVSFSPVIKATDDFLINGTAKPPQEQSYYYPFLTARKTLDFEPTEELCRMIRNRIQTSFVDPIDDSVIYKGVKKELAILLEEGGADGSLLDSFRDDESLIKAAVAAYGSRIDARLIYLAAARGMVEALDDKYCRFLSPTDYREFMEKTHQQKYFGIGVRIAKVSGDGGVRILEVFEGSPALSAGVRKSDRIIKIDDKPVDSLTIEEVSGLIKGAENTMVRLTLTRDKTEHSFEVKRRNIIVHSVRHRMLENRVGYIKIDSFKEELDEEFRGAFTALEKQGITGLVVDLRNNPGGLVRSAQDLCGFFLPSNTLIATFRHKNNGQRRIYSRGRRTVFVPTVLIVNEHSASSSEITAGALKDHGAAIVLGARTRGKGSVQRTWRLKNGTGIKMTIEKIFSPGGFSINSYGITPDIKVDVAPGFYGDKDEGDHKKDPQLKEALDYLSKKAKP